MYENYNFEIETDMSEGFAEVFFERFLRIGSNTYLYQI